jgi:hypothetical protein
VNIVGGGELESVRQEQSDGGGADAEVGLDAWQAGTPGRDGDPAEAECGGDRPPPAAKDVVAIRLRTKELPAVGAAPI